MTPLRRMLSVLLALVLALVGHVVLWTGGVPNSVIVARAGTPDPLQLVLIIVGGVVVGAAVLTVALSSTGPIVVGVVDLVVSLATFVAAGVMLRVITSVAALNRNWEIGLGESVGMGIAALTGAIFLAVGLAARVRRSTPPSGASRGAAVLVAVVGVGAGLPLALAGGYGVYSSAFMLLRTEPQPVPILLVVVGAVLVGAGVYASALSSAGTLLMGAVVSVLGIVGLIAPNLLAAPLRGIDRGVASGFQLALSNGNFAMIGLVILAAGLGVAVRARSVRASV